MAACSSGAVDEQNADDGQSTVEQADDLTDTSDQSANESGDSQDDDTTSDAIVNQVDDDPASEPTAERSDEAAADGAVDVTVGETTSETTAEQSDEAQGATTAEQNDDALATTAVPTTTDSVSTSAEETTADNSASEDDGGDEPAGSANNPMTVDIKLASAPQGTLTAGFPADVMAAIATVEPLTTLTDEELNALGSDANRWIRVTLTPNSDINEFVEAVSGLPAVDIVEASPSPAPLPDG